MSDISESEVSSVGFLSDDEPPQDKCGDLTPLCCDARGTVLAVKEILEVGTVFDAVVGDTCVVNIRFRELRPGARLEPFGDLPSQYVEIKELKTQHAVLAEALEYMKLNERALVRGTKDRTAVAAVPKKLQRARRHYAAANADFTQEEMLKQVPSQEALYEVELLEVERRHTFNDDPEFWKVVLCKPESWLIPDERSTVTVEVADCAAYTKTMPQQTRAEAFHINCDTIPGPLKEVLMSMRLNEGCLVHWPDDETAEEVFRFLRLSGPYTAIYLKQFVTPRQYTVYDARFRYPVLRLGHKLETEEKELAAKSLRGEVRLDVRYEPETGELNRLYRCQGTGPATTGSTILVRVQSSTLTRFLVFTLGRCLSVPYWFHGLCEDISQRQPHILYKGSVELDDDEAEEFEVSKSLSALLDSKLRGPELPLRLVSQILVGVQEARYTTPQDFYYTKFWAFETIEEVNAFVEHLVNNGEFRVGHAATTRWPFKGANEIEFCILGTLAKEVEAWQRLPSGVAPTGLCHLTVALNLACDSSKIGRAFRLCNDGTEFIRQFAARIVDEDEVEDLKMTESELGGVKEGEVPKPGASPLVENLAPKLAEVYRIIGVYAEASLWSQFGLWKRAASLLSKIDESGTGRIEAIVPYPTMTKLVTTLRAQAAFKTGEYELCLGLCEEMPELKPLKAAAAQLLARQKTAQKQMFMRMFAA